MKSAVLNITAFSPMVGVCIGSPSYILVQTSSKGIQWTKPINLVGINLMEYEVVKSWLLLVHHVNSIFSLVICLTNPFTINFT